MSKTKTNFDKDMVSKKFLGLGILKQKTNLESKAEENGITLIALVITIIVLLILSAVTISTLTGENGILTRATEASDKTKEANAKEQVQVEVLGSYGTDGQIDPSVLNNNLKNIEGITREDGTTLDTNPITSLPAIVVIDGQEILIDANGNTKNIQQTTLAEIKGKYFAEDTLIKIDENKVLIPGGATVSGEDSECSSLGVNSAERDNNGLVIYITNGAEITDYDIAKTTYDQFVWVPVETAYIDLTPTDGTLLTNANSTQIKEAVQTEINVGRYPMAIKNGENYFGVLYGFSETNGAVSVTPFDSWLPLSTNGGYSEPDDVSYDANNSNITTESLQVEYNEMLEKVATNGGFWVGRYETSSMVNDATRDNTNQIKVIKGTTQGINNVKWYRMYAQQKTYANLVFGNTSELTSSMIWGSQWDQIMIWMKTVKNTVNTTNGQYYVTNGVGMGNYGVSGADNDTSTSSPAPTGNSEQYEVKNIYDMAGNVSDITLEAYRNKGRLVRRKRLLDSF